MLQVTVTLTFDLQTQTSIGIIFGSQPTMTSSCAPTTTTEVAPTPNVVNEPVITTDVVDTLTAINETDTITDVVDTLIAVNATTNNTTISATDISPHTHFVRRNYRCSASAMSRQRTRQHNRRRLHLVRRQRVPLHFRRRYSQALQNVSLTASDNTTKQTAIIAPVPMTDVSATQIAVKAPVPTVDVAPLQTAVNAPVPTVDVAPSQTAINAPVPTKDVAPSHIAYKVAITITAAPLSPCPSKNKMSKHKVGFDSSWTTSRPWLYSVVEAQDGKLREVMYCKLCKKHNTRGRNGSTAWNEKGFATIRLDKVVEHQTSEMHCAAVSFETETHLVITDAFNQKRLPMGEKEFKAVTCATKILHFLIKNNIAHTQIQRVCKLCYR